VRRRLRALLPRLHLLPPLTTVLAIGSSDPAALAERVAPDGDVLVIDESVDVLEELRARSRAPNVFYLLGWPEVLPLPDGSVDEVVGRPASPDAQLELARVLRT
jgi:ubiquinone/menaquinone biosynthesis C-methylase UbiE